jgi:hypothetical protein
MNNSCYKFGVLPLSLRSHLRDRLFENGDELRIFVVFLVAPEDLPIVLCIGPQRKRGLEKSPLLEFEPGDYLGSRKLGFFRRNRIWL